MKAVSARRGDEQETDQLAAKGVCILQEKAGKLGIMKAMPAKTWNGRYYCGVM